MTLQGLSPAEASTVAEASWFDGRPLQSWAGLNMNSLIAQMKRHIFDGRAMAG
jgi:hypothetical protein